MTILAERMKIVLKDFIGGISVGFYSKDNWETVVEMYWIVWNTWNSTMYRKLHWFFFNAKKAIDNLNWTLLYKFLEDMDIGKSFIKWVKSIYTPPPQRAQRIVNEQSIFVKYRNGQDKMYCMDRGKVM